MLNSPQNSPYFPHLLTHKFILVMVEHSIFSHRLFLCHLVGGLSLWPLESSPFSQVLKWILILTLQILNLIFFEQQHMQLFVFQCNSFAEVLKNKCLCYNFMNNCFILLNRDNKGDESMEKLNSNFDFYIAFTILCWNNVNAEFHI